MKDMYNFVDRRTDAQRNAGLATPVLFWYDTDINPGDGRERRVTRGVAITIDGQMIYAEAICSPKDQFVKSKGRMIVEQRILGRAKAQCWMWDILPGSTPSDCARAFQDDFGCERGAKRAFNAGKIYESFLSNNSSI